MRAPQRITIRLGDDLNWWVESADDTARTTRVRSILDPRQVAHLVQTLDKYQTYGCRPEQLAEAFHVYRIDAEISEGVLRLAATDQSLFDEGNEAFALPVIAEDESGAYYELLDIISAARIRKLNATHHYARQCTVDEMSEELNALDSDRYFSDDTIHAFDEINEILEWKPAEWDDSSGR